MGGEGSAQRPVWGGNELKKTGARSARARTRGQNPQVNNNRYTSTVGRTQICRLCLNPLQPEPRSLKKIILPMFALF